MTHIAPSVWESSCRSTGSSSPASAAAALERWALEPGEQGVSIAVAPRARVVAVVVARQPNDVVIAPLHRDVLPGDSNPWSRQVIRAPSGPVRCIKFNESESSANTAALLLLAATPREAYLWQVHGTDVLEPPLHLVGVEAPPPCLPALAFDSTGSLVVIGGVDAHSAPKLSVFVIGTGDVLAQAQVPTVRSDDACAINVTACNFLRDEFAYVLVAATHVVNRKVGRVLAYNMRGCGDNNDASGFSASHETMALQGAPFLALGLHHAQASTFLVGGEGVVYIFQVRLLAGDGLICENLSEVSLGTQSVPVWLRNGACEDDTRRSACDDNSHIAEDDGGVLAIEAIGCRVTGGPTSLGLYGTAALAVTANAVYAIWGHRQCAERLGTTLALGAAAVCVAPISGILIAGYLHAFAEGGQTMRLTLNSDLRLPMDSRSLASESNQSRILSNDLRLDEEAPSDPPICSVMPIAPIPQDSMLGQALAPSRPATPLSTNLKRASSAPLRGQSASNQPVTFHRKVKSAGYGPSVERPRVPGRPQLCASRRPPKPDFGPQQRGKNRPLQSDQARNGKSLLGGYAAADSGPPLEHCPDQAIPPTLANACAIIDLCYTPQATHLIVAGSDRSIASYRLPLARTRGPDGRPRAMGLTGHASDILSMCPSYADSQSTGGGGGPLLLTTAGDRTVRLWALGGSHAGEDLICFDRLRTNSRSAHKEENPILESAQDAQFMCLDGAITLATGARLGIYKYQLHDQDTNDDIKRLQRLGSYRCCGLLTLPREPSAGQSIVALATNNAVMSGTVLVASSSKRIYAWDVAAEKVLACVPEASLHSRPITCLRLAQPHAEFQSLESMDLFYSAATDNTVKLWDLRTMQECRRFMGGHTHTSQRLRCRISPCLRYLCVPSEDGGVCAYDIRTGNVLGSRHCHRDTVSAVDIHPRSGCMASGGFDGVVNLYRVPSSEAPAKPHGSGGGGMAERRASSETRRLPRTREVCMEMPC